MGWHLPGLRLRKRFVYGGTALLAFLMAAPFVVGPFTTDGIFVMCAALGTAAACFILLPVFYLAPPLGIGMDQLAEVQGGLLTVQTLRGPRSIELSGLTQITVRQVGRSQGGALELWRLRGASGAWLAFALGTDLLATGRTDEIIREALAASPSAIVSTRVARALDSVPRSTYGRGLGPADFWTSSLMTLVAEGAVVGTYLTLLIVLFGL